MTTTRKHFGVRDERTVDEIVGEFDLLCCTDTDDFRENTNGGFLTLDGISKKEQIAWLTQTLQEERQKRDGNKYGMGVDFAKQETVERSVEETWKEEIRDLWYEIQDVTGLQSPPERIRVSIEQTIKKALQTERQKRDEVVEAERERIWTEVSMKTPTLLANYPRGKKDNYNSGRIDGWNICKSFIRQLTHPNNPE